MLVLTIVAGCKLGFENAPRPDAPPPPPDAPFACPTTLVPSNGIACSLLDGAYTNVAAESLVFDADSGEIVNAQGVQRAAGTGYVGGIGFFTVDEMGVFVASRFAVPASTTWTARGSRALVLFAAEIHVVGTIDVGANDHVAGPHGTPGGTDQLRAACEGQTGPFKFSIAAGAGGGGGGGATSGGAGGATAADGSGSTAGGPGGVSCAQPSTIPLRGGNGGGPGGTEGSTVMGGAGGGGGGALALVGMARVEIEGTVATPGAGGQTIAGGSGGGGGGAGGALFVESLDVTIAGSVTANGGGGGPATNPAIAIARGQRGHLTDAQPAAGGANAGAGGAGTSAPTSGSTTTGGGGGGGAVGTIEIKTVSVVTTGATFSPAPRMTQATTN